MPSPTPDGGLDGGTDSQPPHAPGHPSDPAEDDGNAPHESEEDVEQTDTVDGGQSDVPGEGEAGVVDPGAVGGGAWTVQFGTDGDDILRVMQTDAMGDLIVVQSTWESVSKRSAVDGTRLWTSDLGATPDRVMVVEALQADAVDVIVAGRASVRVPKEDPWDTGWDTGSFVAMLAGSDGGILWSQDLWPGRARHVDVDPLGGVLVAGLHAVAGPTGGIREEVLALLGADGSMRWKVSVGPEWEEILSAQLDVHGDALAMGEAYGPASADGRILAAKFSGTDGSTLWSTRFGTEEAEVSHTAVVDPSGNLIVAAASSGDVMGDGNAGSRDLIVFKLAAADGAVLWAIDFGTWAGEYPRSLGVDSVGDIFVMTPQGDDARIVGVVLKLSGMDGQLLWKAEPPADEAEYTGAGTVDAQDDYLLAGTLRELDPHRPIPDTDAFIEKLSGKDGSRTWQARVGAPLRIDDGTRIAIDTRGTAFLGASTAGLVGGPNNLGGRDVFIAKVVESGQSSEEPCLESVDLAGVLSVQCPGVPTMHPNDLDNDGFVDGTDRCPQNTTGEQVPEGGHDQGAGDPNAPTTTRLEELVQSVAIAPGGDLLVVGHSKASIGGEPITRDGTTDMYVRRLSADAGTPRWTRMVGSGKHDYALAVDSDPAGDVFFGAMTGERWVLGDGYMTRGSSPLLAKLDGACGRLLWATGWRTEGDAIVTAIAVSEEGNALVTGHVDGPILGDTAHMVGEGELDERRVFVAGVSGTDGVTQWEKLMAKTEHQSQESIGVDAHGDAFVINGVEGASLVKLTGAQGDVMWEKELQGAKALDVDNNGDPVVLRETGSNWVTKLSGTDGALRWQTQVAAPASPFVPQAEALGPVLVSGTLEATMDGDILVAGNVPGILSPHVGAGLDVYLAKLSGSDGHLLWEARLGVGRQGEAVQWVGEDPHGNTLALVQAGPFFDITSAAPESAEIASHVVRVVEWLGPAGDPCPVTIQGADVLAMSCLGEPVIYPNDSDADGVVDALDPCPLHNPDDADDDGLCGAPAGLTSPWIRQFRGGVALAMTIDHDGNILATGSTDNTTGALLETHNADVIVAKLAPTDGTVHWMEQFGRENRQKGRAIGVDADGRILVVGTLETWNGPSNPPLLSTFLASLTSPEGTLGWEMLFARRTEHLAALGMDGRSNTLFLAGSHSSADQGDDVRVTKLSSEDGSRLWTSDFGTDGSDRASQVALDPDGNALVAGRTTGNLGGDGNAGLGDVFVAKLTELDGQVLWLTQIGAPGDEHAKSISVDTQGDVLLLGPVEEQSRTLVTKLSGADGTVIWTSAIETGEHGEASAISIDQEGDPVIVGTTAGDLDGQGNAGGSDVFVTRLSSDEGHLLRTRQFGTPWDDIGQTILVDADGDTLVGGVTYGNLDGDGRGDFNAFVAKLVE